MSREKIVFQAESAKTVTENIEEEISKTARENSTTEDGVFVKGMALPFGETSRNGVQYERESVKEAAEDLKGRPILFNHKQDFATGHILNIEITEDGMFYEGDLNPNAEMPNGVTVAEAVERGDIRSPSIQAFIEQTGEEADEDAVVADMPTEKVEVADFIEISMVTVPGFPSASAMPEHLQRQGVKPVTEIVGSVEKSESLENPEYEVGDFVEWQFGDGSSQGEIIDIETEPGQSMSAGGNEFTVDEEDDEPLYKIEEWDETAGDDGEFTNNVVKFEGELSSTDRPQAAEQSEAPQFDDMGECISFHMDSKDMDQDQAVAVCMDKMEKEDLPEELQETISKEQFEFSPVPTHVLYDTEEKAQRRAENLGLEDIHEHQMNDQSFYMAGENHEAWINAIERENPLDIGENVKTEQTFDDYPEAAQENARMALDAKEDTGDPNDCGTQVGWERANQLDNGEALSEDTIGRMAAFSRHEDNKEMDDEQGRADCGWMMWNAWGGDEGIEWAENKMDKIEEENLTDETKTMLEEADIMANSQQEDSSQQENTKSEQVSQEAFINFVAKHMEGLSADDIANAVGDSNFTGLDQGEVAELLAMEFELDPDTVMDAIGQLEDMEGEAYNDKDKDEDDDMEDENSEEESTEEQEEKTKGELKDRVEELEERLEKLVSEDEGSSRQESPSAEESESTIKRRPSFRKALNN